MKPGVRYDLKAAINGLFLPGDLVPAHPSQGKVRAMVSPLGQMHTNHQENKPEAKINPCTHKFLPSGQGLHVLCFQHQALRDLLANNGTTK